jgi:hypothetical protein
VALPWVEKKNFADALAWSASIAAHRAAVPCETPGAWQLPLLFGALPSWEGPLKRSGQTPRDHLRKKNEKKYFSRLPRFRSSSSTTNPVCERRVDLLVCSLPLHRHSYIGFILAFASSFHNKQRFNPKLLCNRPQRGRTHIIFIR